MRSRLRRIVCVALVGGLSLCESTPGSATEVDKPQVMIGPQLETPAPVASEAPLSVTIPVTIPIAPPVSVAVSESDAAVDQSPKKYYVGLGVLLNNLGKYTTDPSGTTSLISSVFPELVFLARYPVWERWAVSPLLGFTPFGHQSPDKGETTRMATLEGRAIRPLGPVDLQAGLGLLLSRVSGSGGTIDLGNGNATSTFGLPSDSSTSSLFYWVLGAGLNVRRIFRWENSLLIASPLSSRRALSLVTQFSVGVF